MHFPIKLMAAAALLSSCITPTFTAPTPAIEVEGRDFSSRFAPAARPKLKGRWDMKPFEPRSPEPEPAEGATRVLEERWEWNHPHPPWPTASGHRQFHHPKWDDNWPWNNGGN